MNFSRFVLVGVAMFAAVSLPAKIVSKSVAYEQGGAKLEGWIYYDDAKVSPDKKAPGVLVVHEWWGLDDYAKKRAQQVAKLGYVAFATDMYGAGMATTDPKQAEKLAGQFYGKPLMAERARAGLDQLLASGVVDVKRVAVIGYCFGGAVAQVLAYSGAPLVGMVSFHGNLVPASAEAAAKNQAKFLICHGAIDPFVSAEQIANFSKSLNEGKFDYQFISYSGAVHAFTNPAADEIAARTGIPIKYNAVADQRSWAHMKLFLKEIFTEKKS